MKKLLVSAAALAVALFLAFGRADADGNNNNDPYGATKVNVSATQTGATSVICVQAVDGGSTQVLGADGGLIGRKFVEIQNLGSAELNCTLNAAATTTNGRKIPADKTLPWSLDVANAVQINCNTTATQYDGGCTVVTEAR